MKKALLVVDVQEDFIKDYQEKNKIINMFNKYIDEYNNNKLDVVYIKTVFPNSLFRRKIYGYVISGTKGAKIPNSINVVSEGIFQKKSADAFKNSLLVKYLRAKGIGQVDIIGLNKIMGLSASKKVAEKFGFKANLLESDNLYNIENKDDRKLVG